MKANSFYIKQCAEDGIEVKIPFPDGTDSDATMVIRGTDSDVFRKAARESARQKIKIAELPEDERDSAFLRASNIMLASLVKDWSLEDECTVDNIVDLFDNAPHVRELVDSVATKRANFFKKPLSN